MEPVISSDTTSVFRILDANLNRLREALRVIEEYTRFFCGHEAACIRIKGVRHSLEQVEEQIGRENLLRCRDTGSDPLSGPNRPEEMRRDGCRDVLHASLKRAQEASRVIEEYAKVISLSYCSDTAKSIRFAMYSLEKELSGVAHE